jgi:hypothetical protein
MAIINGRRVNVNNIPHGGVYGRQLIEEAGLGKLRRPVVRRGGLDFETIEPNRRYSRHDLTDKRGEGVKVTSIPIRDKGGFDGRRDPLSKRIITEQVYDIAEKLFRQGVDFDEDNARWMVVPRYNLPPQWHHIARSSALMVAFPDEYPARPPIGFYLMADIPLSPDGHFYEGVAHDAWAEPIRRGWKWYCVYIHAGAWQPAPYRQAGDWKRGDNLYTYFTLINEALANGG